MSSASMKILLHLIAKGNPGLMKSISFFQCPGLCSHTSKYKQYNYLLLVDIYILIHLTSGFSCTISYCLNYSENNVENTYPVLVVFEMRPVKN